MSYILLGGFYNRNAEHRVSSTELMVDCKDIAETLLDCLRQTECMKSGKGAKECLQLTDDCRVYRNTYFECKRSQLDMRTRIRGMKQH